MPGEELRQTNDVERVGRDQRRGDQQDECAADREGAQIGRRVAVQPLTFADQVVSQWLHLDSLSPEVFSPRAVVRNFRPFSTDVTRAFTSEQAQAIARREGDLMLSANAGSGKTKTLIDRVARLLLAGVDPEKLTAIGIKAAVEGCRRPSLIQRAPKIGAKMMMKTGTVPEETL